MKDIRSFTIPPLAHKRDYTTILIGRQTVTVSLNYRIYSQIWRDTSDTAVATTVEGTQV